VLQPVPIVITDEGLNGPDLHLINETTETLSLRMDLVCLRDGAVTVKSATRAVAPHRTARNVLRQRTASASSSISPEPIVSAHAA
jgi:hypothetical protein